MNWQKSIKRILVTILAAGLLVFFPGFTSTAQADDGLVTVAQEFLRTVNEARATFDEVSRDSQNLLNQGMDEARKLLSSFPTDLQRLAAETDVAARDQLRNEVLEKQQSLQGFAQSLDEQLTQISSADKQYQTAIEEAYELFKKSIAQSKSDLKMGPHQQVAELKQTFKETAKTLSGLADDTTRILSGKVPFLQSRFDTELSAIDKAFSDVNRVLDALR